MEFVKNKTLDKLKYDLVRSNLINYEDIEKAQEIAIAQKINFGQVLINSNLITEESLLKFVESKLHIPYVDLENYSLDKNCLKYISFNDAQKYRIIPLFKIENELTIAMCDPLDLLALDTLAENIDCQIEPVLCSENSILKKINEYYQTDNVVGEIYTNESSTGYDWRESLQSSEFSDEHMQNIIRAILKQAISTDVHELFLEHTSNGLVVNFKNTGNEVNNMGQIPSVMAAQFIFRLKVLCSLDPQVSEIPQLGKFVFKVDDINFITSISCFPTIQGERILLKIYKPPLALTSIVKDEKDINLIRNSLLIPGITLVCGSPLSGKTHIIYSVLSMISGQSRNVMTLESITKYNLENVHQCELNENIGFNLDKAMRFIEFQSPEIVYFEGLTTKTGLDYFSSLVFKNKILITEFLADNIEDLRKKLCYDDFMMFKSLINCLIFIHNKNSIEVFDKNALEKYLT